MSDTLRACPFCGGPGKVVLKQWDLFNVGAIVQCQRCGARTKLIVPSAEYSAKDKAIRRWNRRAR